MLLPLKCREIVTPRELGKNIELKGKSKGFLDPLLKESLRSVIANL